MDFTATKDFYSEELKSQYAKGMSYTARSDNVKLLEVLPKWEREGKIVYGRPAPAKVAGRG